MPPLTLEVVLKITERCNIDCTYCYMFNKGNEDYKAHPPLISRDTVNALTRFVSQAVADFDLKKVSFVMHGGEPLLMRQARFADMCERLAASVPKGVECTFGIQTNAVLIDESWIRLLSRLRVAVGISLDGPKKFNDRYRIDHDGEGTYDQTIAGLQMVQDAHRAGLMPAPGVICVINPEYSGREIYRHFIHDLGLHYISFLLPMESHDTWGATNPDSVGRFLTEVTREWVADNNPYVAVRILNSFLRFLTAPLEGKERERFNERDRAIIVSVASDGSISADDELKPIGYGSNLGNVATTTLAEFLQHPQVLHHKEIQRRVPASCGDCEWVGYCRGGAQNQVSINRYSNSKHFGNRSVICPSLKMFYSEATAFALSEGTPTERIVAILEAAAAGVEVAPDEWFVRQFAGATGGSPRKIWLSEGV